jgi:proteasome accessory factor B
VLVAQGRAAGVRRYAEEILPGPDGDRVTVSYSDPQWLAGWLVKYGSDVLVLAPDEVRKAVVGRLQDLLDALSVASPGDLVDSAGRVEPAVAPGGRVEPAVEPTGRVAPAGQVGAGQVR